MSSVAPRIRETMYSLCSGKCKTRWAPTVTPERVIRRPSPAAARRMATCKCKSVLCSSSSPEGEGPHGRRSANYQPNFWNYGSIESLAGEHDHNPVRLQANSLNRTYYSSTLALQMDPLDITRFGGLAQVITFLLTLQLLHCRWTHRTLPV